MKRVFLSFLLMMAFAVSNAQASHSIAPKKIEAGDSQMWWGYCGDDPFYYGGTGFGGESEFAVFETAIFLPGNDKLLANKTIEAVRFYAMENNGLEYCYLGFSSDIYESTSTHYFYVINPSDIKYGEFTDIALSEPHAIPAEGVYLVMRFYVSSESLNPGMLPVGVDFTKKNVPNSYFIRFSSETWSFDWRDYSDDGSLAIQVLLEGEFPHHAVSVNDFGDVFALSDEPGQAALRLTNDGVDQVDNISYTITTDGKESEERQMNVPTMPTYGSTSTVLVPVEGEAVAGGRNHQTINITKVNGVGNTASKEEAKSEGDIITLSQKSPKKTVVESFTSTSGGKGPLTITSHELLKKTNPNDAICISVHTEDYRDPMVNTNYGIEFADNATSYLNRIQLVDSYYGTGEREGRFALDVAVDKANAMPAEASVELAPVTLSKNGRIDVSSQTIFRYNNDEAPYALGYVLLADSLTGNDDNWGMSNLFADLDVSDDPNLAPWHDAPYYITDIAYNEVPVIVKGGMNGMSGSIKAPIVDGVPQTHSTFFTIENNELVQNVNKLSVVALLFNTTTGAIVNAAIQPVRLADDFPRNNATISMAYEKTVLLGDTAQVPVVLKNMGANGIHSVGYVIRTGRILSDTLHVEVDHPITNYGGTGEVLLKVPADSITGRMAHTYYIVKINGKENEALSSKNVVGNLLTIGAPSPRKTVIEEFTGTWSGLGARDMVGMSLVEKNYPDDAIVIAIHKDDPMEVSAFSSMTTDVYPNCNVNRHITDVDLYYGINSGEEFGLGEIIEQENAELVEGAVSLSTPVLDEKTGQIDFSADVTFQLNRRSSPYALAYVLLADGLKGTGADWEQRNYLAGNDDYRDNEDLKDLVDADEYMTDVTYNNVGIDAIGISNGISKSISSTVEEGVAQTHTAQFNISNNHLAKINPAGLKVVALLYNTTDKRILNADRKQVVVVTDGIRQMDTEDNEGTEEIARYTLGGVRVSQPVKGLNLVKMRNGKVVKVMR